MNRIRIVIVVLLCSLLSACAALGPPSPMLNEAEVLGKRGEPTHVWNNEDGTRTLEYATQPYGVSAWMYTIDPNGTVVRQFDALSDENRRRVKPGMSSAEIRRLLGQERSVQRFALSGEEVWDWNVPRDHPGVVATLFNVHFIGDKVVRTSLSHIYPESRWRMGFGFGHGMGSHWGLGVGWGWGWPGYGPGCCW